MQAEYQKTILTPVFPNQGSAINREKHFDGTLIVLVACKHFVVAHSSEYQQRFYGSSMEELANSAPCNCHSQFQIVKLPVGSKER
jgi:hypothetical protein